MNRRVFLQKQIKAICHRGRHIVAVHVAGKIAELLPGTQSRWSRSEFRRTRLKILRKVRFLCRYIIVIRKECVLGRPGVCAGSQYPHIACFLAGRHIFKKLVPGFWNRKAQLLIYFFIINDTSHIAAGYRRAVYLSVYGHRLFENILNPVHKIVLRQIHKILCRIQGGELSSGIENQKIRHLSRGQPCLDQIVSIRSICFVFQLNLNVILFQSCVGKGCQRFSVLIQPVLIHQKAQGNGILIIRLPFLRINSHSACPGTRYEGCRRHPCRKLFLFHKK